MSFWMGTHGQTERGEALSLLEQQDSTHFRRPDFNSRFRTPSAYNGTPCGHTATANNW